jgi:hypothetical protein
MELTALRPGPRWDSIKASERKSIASSRIIIRRPGVDASPSPSSSSSKTAKHIEGTGPATSIQTSKRVKLDDTVAKVSTPKVQSILSACLKSVPAPVVLRPSAAPVNAVTDDWIPLERGDIDYDDKDESEEGQLSDSLTEKHDDVGDEAMAAHLSLNLVSDSEGANSDPEIIEVGSQTEEEDS